MRNYAASWRGLLALLLLLVLQGCSNQYQQAYENNFKRVTANLEAIGKALDDEDPMLTNALIIKKYAKSLAEKHPEYEDIATQLGRAATRGGAPYQGLKKRLQSMPQKVENSHQYELANTELKQLNMAVDPLIFNDSLLDVVNTLADLSGGDLNRISIPKDTAVSTLAGGQVPGSYLVGNPSYGQWKQDSSGGSFWEFYGQYRLFSDLLGGPGYYGGRIGYDDWNSSPRYSYYRDYGSDLYGSRSDQEFRRTRDSKMESKGVKHAKPSLKYGSPVGQKRHSNYVAAKKDASATAGRKYGASGGPKHYGGKTDKRSSSAFSSFRSNKNAGNSGKRSSSIFGASSRNSSRSSRSFGRGK